MNDDASFDRSYSRRRFVRAKRIYENLPLRLVGAREIHNLLVRPRWYVIFQSPKSRLLFPRGWQNPSYCHISRVNLYRKGSPRGLLETVIFFFFSSWILPVNTDRQTLRAILSYLRGGNGISGKKKKGKITRIV